MLRYLSVVLGVALATPFLAFAYNGTLAPPELVEGQYVYTIPADYSPEGIGRGGLDDIQAVAANLHHPFYVIIVDSLPDLSPDQRADSRSKGYTETGIELQASYAVDRLAEDWAAAYPDIYEVQTSSVFLLSFNPRQYRLLAGSRWKAELGLEKKGLEPYDDPFVAAVTGSPKDPKGGIINTMTKLDEHIYDQTDPVRVAERQAQRERELEERRRNRARGNLDEQITRMQGLLNENPRFLPADVAAYETLLAQGQDVRANDDTAYMAAQADKMVGSADVLEEYVRAEKAEHRAAITLNIIKWALIFGALGFLFGLVIRRKRSLDELRGRYRDISLEWHEKIGNAAQRYVDAYMEREDIIDLGEMEGKTKVLWDEVTSGVDDIWKSIQGLKKHVTECDGLASKGGFFNFGPLQTALLDIDSPFDFDTGVINREELFGGDTKTIRVEPSRFTDQLEEQFRDNRHGWDRLKDAAEAWGSMPSTLFPHTGMDMLFAKADRCGFPHAWIDDHPLFGDDESDEAFYEVLNNIRAADPVAYLDRIKDERANESKLMRRATELSEALDALAAVSSPVVPDFGDAELDAEDDPVVTLTAARHAEHLLAGVLAEYAPQKNVSPVKEQAQHAASLFRKVASQVAIVESAIKGAEDAIGDAREFQSSKVVEAEKMARKRFEEVTNVHKHTASVRQSIDAGVRVVKRAQELLMEAQTTLQTRRYVEAQRLADQAFQTFQTARNHWLDAVKRCDDLDRDKANYERKVAHMESRRSDVIRRMKRYNGRTSKIAVFQRPQVGQDSTDYAACLAILDRQEREWESHARKAQREYEEEQARKRREEERKRREAARKRREEEERRRRSSYSSYSSGSGGWGGGGSSSIGGSFGGGGSSSVGGGW